MSRGQKGVGRQNGDGKMRKTTEKCGKISENAEKVRNNEGKCGRYGKMRKNVENGKHKRIEDKEWVQMSRKTD